MTDKEQRRAEERAAMAGVQLLPPELEALVKEAAFNFHGSGTVFESAVGALVVGQLYGWQVLRLMHAGPAYAKYQKILGVNFKDVLPARGPLAKRSLALDAADKIGEFWKIVRGEVKGRSAEFGEAP